jgi:hypothetical protein
MKKTILLISLALAVLTVNAQQSFTVSRADSLVNADTVIYTIDHKDLQKADFYFSSYFQADSITGTTAATAYLQVSNSLTEDRWYSIDTVSINDEQVVDWATGTIQANRLRWYIISTGTQRTWLYFDMHFVPRK